MNTTNEALISVFSEDDLRILITAVSGYMTMKRKYKRSTEIESGVFNKVVEAWNTARELNCIETGEPFIGDGRKNKMWIPNEWNGMGIAEYKMMEALDMA